MIGSDENGTSNDDRPRLFPAGALRATLVLIGIHVALGAWASAAAGEGWRILVWGGLAPGVVASEPWRLLTSLFLHVDPRHALWNGVSMLVFAVALIDEIGYARTALIYLAAGVGGGVAALAFASSGAIVVGSSGAVAGLFGAWVAWTLGEARHATLSRRATVRTIGIAFLMLPALLNPTTSDGRPISISSHMGGLATGMAIGAILWTTMRRREPEPTDDGDEENVPDENGSRYLN